MPRTLKVYGWLGRRRDATVEGNHHGQTREIVAAYSLAEVSRLSGLTRYTLDNWGCESGNKEELETAMAKPGTIFWKPLNHRTAEWREATSRG